MKVKIRSSKIVKPVYDGGVAPSTGESMPLNVFDRVTYDVHITVIYAFRPPNPPNAALEQGLAKVLAVYREWAGKLSDGPGGRLAVLLLNDRGVRFVEATVDAPLAGSMPFKPSPELLRLHPSVDGPVEELLQVQLTRFACGSLVVGFTSHHHVGDGQATKLRISVNGRTRMRPPVQRDYFGNMVLWAFPRSDAGELVSRPVQHAADLIHRAVSRVDDAYFRSFIDFASLGAVEAEGLAPTADESQVVLCPDLEMDSWLGINFYDLNFGGGCPFYFMPSYLPMEGTLFLLPSFLGDGSIEAYVSLFEGHLEEFKKICYNIA